jgi:hypothetical protein
MPLCFAQKLSADLDWAMSRLNLSHINMAMDSSTQTSADAKHTCICREVFELAEKLRIELYKKDEELHKREQEKEVCKLFLHVHTVNKYLCAQKLSTDLALEKARADQLETELDGARKMIDNHQVRW